MAFLLLGLLCQRKNTLTLTSGEPPTPVVTTNGVNKMSCIDPKNEDTALDGFALPTSLGEGVGDGLCMGVEVRVSSCISLLERP